MMQIMQKQMPSTLEHSFSQIPRARIPRSSFRRPYERKMTFNADYIVPFYWDEAYPADTANMDFTALIRLVTPEVPFMDNLYADFFFFFVPNRLVHNDWEKLMGHKDNPADSIDFVTPKVTSPAGGFVTPSNWAAPTIAELAGALYDYYESPTRVAGYTQHNYLARGHNLIINNWFRDENLQNSLTVDKGAGPDTYTNYTLQKRGKRHDYFTSCLPFLQKGAAELLPLGTSAPIQALGAALSDVSVISPQQGGAYRTFRHNAVANSNVFLSNVAGVSGNALVADLTAASAATISSLYQAFAIQDLLQTDARGGTRYVELINSHFGVTSPDFRLQRPEYLGGASVPFVVSPIAQTSATSTTELGNLAATAAVSVNNVGFIKSFVEHGFIHGFVSVRSDLTYQQGLHRSLSRSSRYDFYFPSLANLSEQAVLNKEIYVQGTAADNQVFGYQERWSELRYGRSTIAGRMRSNDPATLDSWHLAENFSALPVLNASFIQQNTPMARVLAVTTEPHFKADIYGRGNWVRPLPLYSVPGLMNRF